ncbi:MAG: exodeoxyribonuclease III [Candidatus Sumerlaeota bacterium]|nr:exodeoxyribonuclease III [Candidatus Sumerlaeota bacterium]
MKIATFNCNSIRQRFEAIMEWLAFNDPDVLCLQETKCQDKDFPAQDFKDAGYHVIFKGMKSYNGVAILSKEEPQEVAWGLDDKGASDKELGAQDDARLIRAKIGGVWVVNTYVPQGFEIVSPKFAYKLEWFARLKKYFKRHFSPDEELLWCGDLNVAPEAMDVHDPKGLLGHVCFNPEITRTFYDVCKWGLADCFRIHHPEPGQYTFWDYMGNSFDNNKGWRLDFLMATRPLAARCIDCFVDREPRAGEKPSDHTFLVGIFD